MGAGLSDDRIEVFSTCPPSSGSPPGVYAGEVERAVRWSEQAGCRGMLIYSDNSLVDPWLTAQRVVRASSTLCPLVAVQPVYMHPYAVAKMVASLAFLHGRRVYLNMVAGGFKNDLTALDDRTPHDRRYQRLAEYTIIIKRLLAGSGPVTFDGEFYRVDKLRLSPSLPPDLFPGIFVSGSSEAGVEAAAALGATAIRYPKPAEAGRETPPDPRLDHGIRVGIIARDREDDAWTAARARFPEDRRGQIAHTLAMKVSDSVWHAQLSAPAAAADGGPYWLVPFHNYKTMCPYLVGSHDRVGAEIARHLAIGCRTFILDVPLDRDDLGHAGAVFDRALERCPVPSPIS